MSINILLVEDDEELASLVRDYLIKNNFDVQVITDGIEAAKQIPIVKPDLVILDIMLPGITGMDVCREVRPFYTGPILMLTALDDDVDQMLGLELGADDYIVKPVQPRLLLTRIRTLLRRISSSTLSSDISKINTVIQVGSLTINTGNRTVSVDNRLIELTSAEFELLLLLAQDIGHVVDRNTIVQELRGFEYDGMDRSIDRRISRLRKKLQNNNDHDIIKTIRGKGYQLCISKT